MFSFAYIVCGRVLTENVFCMKLNVLHIKRWLLNEEGGRGSRRGENHGNEPDLLGMKIHIWVRQELGLGMAYTRRSAFLTASEVGIRLITLAIRLITLSSAADRSIADLMITPLATDQWGRANTDRCRLNLAPTSTHAVFRSQLLSLALKT